MSDILKAAERSSQIMASFSAQLANAPLERAVALPLMAATSLILVGTDKVTAGQLLPNGFNAVRTALKSRFGAIERIVKA